MPLAWSEGARVFRLLRIEPPHGWRAVWWELGIVTLGVLIALFGEQLIGSINTRAQLAEFRRAADEELATNLFAYKLRVDQRRCISQRIAELEAWRDRAIANGGRALPLSRDISRPNIYSMRAATWDSRGQLIYSMTLDERLNYAEAYSSIASNADQMLDERETWRSLAAFNKVDQLDSASVMRLNELLYRAKSLNDIIARNFPMALDFGQRVGVRPAPGRRAAYLKPQDPRFCTPLLVG